MDTLSIIVLILQALCAILGIALRCYQLYKETRKNDDTDRKK